jgi:putative signal transducing protein
MPPINPQNEREQYARVYAGMPDLQLADLAQEAYNLTEYARQALRAELAKRGLNVPLADSPHGGPLAAKLVTIARFRDLWEADLVRIVLESANVKCFLLDENIVRLNWFYAYAMRGVKLCVADDDASDAREIFNLSPPESFMIEGSGPYEPPRCPNCASLDLHHDELTRAAYASFFFFPWMLWISLLWRVRRKAWHCHACGQFFEEADD